MPFTTEQFFDVFREYNSSVFPFQIIIPVLSLVIIFILRLRNRNIVKITGGFLSLLWIWIGYIYHIRFFSGINNAAYIFGALFVIQGILFFIEFIFRNKIELNFENKFNNYTAYILLLFGVILYPAIGLITGKSLDITITMGLPCPSVIYTFGILIFAGKSLPKYLLIIPVLWAFIGFFAALKFGVYQDIALPVSAILTITIIYSLNKKEVIKI
jgi:hypothetical protein